MATRKALILASFLAAFYLASTAADICTNVEIMKLYEATGLRNLGPLRSMINDCFSKDHGRSQSYGLIQDIFTFINDTLAALENGTLQVTQDLIDTIYDFIEAALQIGGVIGASLEQLLLDLLQLVLGQTPNPNVTVAPGNKSEMCESMDLTEEFYGLDIGNIEPWHTMLKECTDISNYGILQDIIQFISDTLIALENGTLEITQDLIDTIYDFIEAAIDIGGAVGAALEQALIDILNLILGQTPNTNAPPTAAPAADQRACSSQCNFPKLYATLLSKGKDRTELEPLWNFMLASSSERQQPEYSVVGDIFCFVNYILCLVEEGTLVITQDLLDTLYDFIELALAIPGLLGEFVLAVLCDLAINVFGVDCTTTPTTTVDPISSSEFSTLMTDGPVTTLPSTDSTDPYGTTLNMI